MPATTAIDIVVPESVSAEVQRKSAEVEFQCFRETVAEHFADALSTSLFLLEDPDADDRNWVVFEVTLPADSDLAEIQRKKNTFYDDLIHRSPHIAQPIYSLGIEFA